jgi:aminopeptidase N
MSLFRRPGALRLACALAATIGVGCSSEAPSSPNGAKLDVARYDLQGDYDWARGRLVATLNVTLAPAGDGTKTVVLDSAVTEVKTVRLSGGDALPFTTDAAAKQLRVDIASLPESESYALITLEIAYEAEPSGSLLAVIGRKGDPLKDVRALFTMSEPLGAESWMPCHDAPSDRALFSVDMGMASAETMIASGDLLVDDEPGKGGSRRMKYQTAYTLPTYLMAFAISDFEVESTMKGRVRWRSGTAAASRASTSRCSTR